MTKLRAAATITLYVYGENEQQLINEANLVVKAMNLADDCNATLTDLQTINFGKLEAKKIDFNKKTTFEEFVDTKKLMTFEEIEEEYGAVVESKKAYNYSDGLFIEVLDNGGYHLTVDRSCYESKDLGELERRLWDDFAREEINGYD